jgi:hypothetical protein
LRLLVAQVIVTYMDGGAENRTEAAFGVFRASFGLRKMRIKPANQDQMRQMEVSDGLGLWHDGPADQNATQGALKPPVLTYDEVKDRITLWAVRPADVPCALESCDFGKGLKSGVIKHSNLTGGAAAHCAGELVILDDETILLNGSSGRYGPETVAELNAVAKAFKNSGYKVWCMGFDEEQGRSLPFGGSTPAWVA